MPALFPEWTLISLRSLYRDPLVLRAPLEEMVLLVPRYEIMPPMRLDSGLPRPHPRLDTSSEADPMTSIFYS